MDLNLFNLVKYNSLQPPKKDLINFEKVSKIEFFYFLTFQIIFFIIFLIVF